MRGSTAFVADLPADDCLRAVFVRSTEAHAELSAVLTHDAEAAPGVVAVLTAEDLELAPFLYFEPVPEVFARPPLATGRVRFVGEAVALVIADTEARAVDAAELVQVHTETRPAVVDPDDALEHGAPLVAHEHGSNEVMHYDKGRISELFAAAAHVEVSRCPNQRMASAPMEPSGMVVRPTAAGGIDVWATTQGVHQCRDELARALGLDLDLLRVRSAAVGGGFGGRHSIPIEFVVLAAAALRLGRGVRWVETRTENLLGMVHGRAQRHEVSMGFDDAGRIVALAVRNVADCGAYPHFGPLMPFGSRKLACGPYRVPVVDYEWVAVATHTNPVGAYRGAGQPEATNGLERTMDAAARSLGIDPLELRRRNLISSAELPHDTPTRLTYDSGDYAAALARAADLVDLDRWRAEQRRRRAEPGDPIQIGVGFASYVSVADGQEEFGAVDVSTDGAIRVRCGTFSHGQSHATTFGRVVAAELGVRLAEISYVDADTALVPRGSGTGGSRSAQIAGSSALQAARELVAAAAEVAARLLEADPADLAVMSASATGEAGIGVRGVPTSVIGWARLASEAGPDGLSAEVVARTGGVTHPSGSHAAVVDVDLATGRVRVLRHVAVDDCGTVLEPAVVAGQQHGGSAAGIGQALFEEIVYGPDGSPLTATFADYLLPSAAELPSFDTATMDIPTPLSPNGAKGIGENGAIAAPTAVQNAVIDAVAHLGVRHIDLPLTPERVWRAITAARPG